jgi:hypothetical protein
LRLGPRNIIPAIFPAKIRRSRPLLL